jgi:hypothetical protein
MKKILLFPIAFVICFIFHSCKKTNPDKPDLSRWVFMDSIYQTTSLYESSYSIAPEANLAVLTALDSPKIATGVITQLTILTATLLTKSVNLKVANRTGNPGLLLTDCYVDVSNINNAYSSLGSKGDSVYITVSGNKITAEFNNVSLKDNATNVPYPVSGILITTIK